MIKPKTRKEVFMDAIAKGKKPAIEPLTREEVLMAEHAEREASGGGGGYTPLIIILDNDGNYTANMTFEEAYKSCTSGIIPAFVTLTIGGEAKQFWGFRQGLYGENYLDLTYVAKNDAKRSILFAANGDIVDYEEES